MTENENEELKDIMVEGFPVLEHTGGAGCFRSLVDIFHYPFPLYRLFFCPANRVWGQTRPNASM